MGLLIAIGVVLALYAAVIVVLALSGRGDAARAVARFIPDCLVLTKRLAADERVGRRHKVALGAMALYLASPIDLVPDFIPVVGQMDDAIVVLLVLRYVARAAGPDLLREHWPGPPESLALVVQA